MEFSTRWLADYVDLPDDLHELARGLTAAGLAVEGIEPRDGDTVLDVDVTTNRPDAMCHLGLAREAALVTGTGLRAPFEPRDAEETEADPGEAGELASVGSEDPALCPRFVARIVRGVTVGPSPDWLAERLTAIGLRPINNVVDVTNFVLWETGQPLHAYDLDRVAGRELTARLAREGETLTTLDGEERELAADSLVIADADGPVGLAGVMGGADSEVTGSTRDVLLEAAHFDRASVRRTASRFGLHTDASHRFERGTDPAMCGRAAERAARLIAELGGGEVVPGTIDFVDRAMLAGERYAGALAGTLDLARLERFAGASYAPEEVERWLAGLGFDLERIERPSEGNGGAPAWRVGVPSWRRWDFVPTRPDGDVWEHDLFEEVLRIGGLDRLPATLPSLAGADAPLLPELARRERLRDTLAACGYAEAINFAFHDPSGDESLPPLVAGRALALANPLSELYSVLRRSLGPGLVESARFNLRRGAAAVRLFEIGHVFAAGREPGRADGDGEGGVELESIALVAGGLVGDPWQRQVELDLFDLKGAVERLAEALAVEVEARPAEGLPGLVPGTAAHLFRRGGSEGRPIGWMGRVDDDDLPVALFAAELETEALGGGDLGAGDLAVEIPSRFPGVGADLTLTHRREVAWSDIRTLVSERAAPELVDFRLKDRYEGEGVPDGAVATTLGFLYGSPARSLTQDEVNERQEALGAALEERFGLGAG